MYRDLDAPRLFVISNKKNRQHTVHIEWPETKNVSWFLLKVREAFEIIEEWSFVLEDASGHVVVISEFLPAGEYLLLETKSNETIDRIIHRVDTDDSINFPSSSSSFSVSSSSWKSGTKLRRRSSHEGISSDTDMNFIRAMEELASANKDEENQGGKGGGGISVSSSGDLDHASSSSSSVVNGNSNSSSGNEHDANFEVNLLRIACADALIANERTWLAWTRTSLNIMTCCFTFTFLDDWSSRPLYTKILCNICIVFFCFAFAGCYVCGYLRYRKFASLLRTTAFASSFEAIEVDDYNFHKIWAYFLGFQLAFASVVYMGIAHRDNILAGL